MKKFEAADIVEINDLVMEPVYFASGAEPTPVVPTPVKPEADGNWTIGTEWCNHNSGSHSEIKIKAHNYGTFSGDNLKMYFYVNTDDYVITEITPGDECLIVTDQSNKSFVLTRTGRHYNPGENIEFVMQLKVKKAAEEKAGAAGTTGNYENCNIICVGYEAS